MKASTVQLRQYIRDVLVEDARSTQNAQTQGLALYFDQDPDAYTYVLYNPEKLEAFLIHTEEGEKLTYFSYRAIIAVIGTRLPIKGQAWNVRTVNYAAADQGYGPLMYDIVMAQEGGLVPDRRSVSSAAKKVWQYYHDSRPDVKKKSLDNVDQPKTEPTIDDAEVYGGEDNPLNYAYFATRKPDIAGLKKNHVEAMKRLQKYTFVEKQLLDLAINYFDARYRGGT